MNRGCTAHPDRPDESPRGTVNRAVTLARRLFAPHQRALERRGGLDARREALDVTRERLRDTRPES